MGGELASGQSTTRASVDSNGVEGNATSISPAFSSDARFVAFASQASNLVAGDTNGAYDIFVLDRLTALVERVSVDSLGAEGNGDSGRNLGPNPSAAPAISADGHVVAFESYASNLIANDTNGQPDIFVRDRVTGITERISVDSTGAEGDDGSYWPAISADGRIIVFFSWASNLIANDTNAHTDVFVHDRQSGITERVSVDSSGVEADLQSYYPSISADGNLVAFASLAWNLIPGQSNGNW
jgi:Tol biopolymer transport system component